MKPSDSKGRDYKLKLSLFDRGKKDLIISS